MKIPVTFFFILNQKLMISYDVHICSLLFFCTLSVFFDKYLCLALLLSGVFMDMLHGMLVFFFYDVFYFLQLAAGL